MIPSFKKKNSVFRFDFRAHLNIIFKMVTWQGFQTIVIFLLYEFTHLFLSFVPRIALKSAMKFTR